MKIPENQTKMDSKLAEMALIYAEKFRQIKDEHDMSMAIIQSAMIAATGNYSKKCCDFEAISKELDEERTKNAALKQQIISLEDTIKLKDDLIFGQKKYIENSNEKETVYLNVINQLKCENPNRLGSKVVDIHEGDQDSDKEMAIVKGMLTEMIAFEKYAIEIEEQEKDINGFIAIGRLNEKNVDSKENMCGLDNSTSTTINDTKLAEAIRHNQNMQNLLKSERENFTWINRQQRNRIEKLTKVLKISARNTRKLNELFELERNKTAKLSMDIWNLQSKYTKLDSRNHILKQQVKFKESLMSRPQPEKDEFDQELFKRQRDQIKALQSQLKQTEERAEKDIINQQQLLTRLREMSNNFNETVNNNRQLIESLTSKQNVLKSKVIRHEKVRHALVHQKQYLLSILSSYESFHNTMIQNDSAVQKRRKITSLKSVVLVVIAVRRMKPIDHAR